MTIADGMKNGRNLARTALHQLDVFALDDVESADARGHIHANLIQVRLLRLPLRHFHGEIGGGQGDLDEPPHFFQFFFLDPLERVEVLYFARDLAIEFGGIKMSDAIERRSSRRRGSSSFPRSQCPAHIPIQRP